jgi:hypothetical protein
VTAQFIRLNSSTLPQKLVSISITCGTISFSILVVERLPEITTVTAS